MASSAVVEAEDELVKVGLQMLEPGCKERLPSNGIAMASTE